MKKEVLQMRKRILGEEHPDTILAMNNLDFTLRQQARLRQKHANPRRAARSPVRPIAGSSGFNTPSQSPRRKRVRVFAYVKIKLQK
jgi:hypothetical protein